MGLNYAQLTTLAGQLSGVATLINQTKDMCSQLKTSGTELYNNGDLLVQFPNDGTALKAQLMVVNSALNTFIKALNQLTPPNS